MKLEVTELGPVKRAIKIEVPEDAVNQEFDRVYTNLKIIALGRIVLLDKLFVNIEVQFLESHN